MRAAQVLQPTGPADVRVVDVDEPVPGPHDVLVEVHSVGISFPDLLLSKGAYQLRPEPPFTLGVDVAGTVVSTGSTSGGGSTSRGGSSSGGGSRSGTGGGADLAAGMRVCGVVPYGGAGERAVIPATSLFPLPDRLSYDEGAALPMNYLTALFALQERGQVRQGETVLVHGAAGGVGTATLQVAKGLGARTIGVVSTPEKADVARAAGADETVLVDGFKDAVTQLTGGRGVDVVLDVVGGDVFTDSLRCLAELGRLLVVGFAAGQGIPEVKVNRLLLGNVDVRGVGWGGYAMTRPSYMHDQWQTLLPMIESGVVSPPVGATYDLADFGRALQDMEARRTLGKAVVHVR
jgi:NADPH2:quinone reductase